MAIIYTYPSATPTLSDLLIFSDVSVTDPQNATRKCTVNSLVSLVGALVPGGGTVTSIGLQGGTTGLTIATTTTNPITTTGTFTVGGVLVAANGGTGHSSYTVGDILYASGATTLSKLPSTTSGFALTAQGAGVAPIWAAQTDTTYTAGDGLDLTGTVFSTDLRANGGLVINATELQVDLAATDMANHLAVSDGGTGQTSYTDGQLLIGNTTGNTLNKATLTAGTNITINNSGGGIEIVASNTPAYTWTLAGESGPSQSITDTNTVSVLGRGPAGTPAFNGGFVTAAANTDRIFIGPPSLVDTYTGLGLSGSAGGAFTPSTNLAAYYCIGATVYIEFYMSWAHAEQAGCSGDIRLTGLPIVAYQTGVAIDNGNCVIHVNTNMSTGTVTTLAPTTGWVGYASNATMNFRKMHGSTNVLSNSQWADVLSEGSPAKTLAGTITYIHSAVA